MDEDDILMGEDIVGSTELEAGTTINPAVIGLNSELLDPLGIKGQIPIMSPRKPLVIPSKQLDELSASDDEQSGSEGSLPRGPSPSFNTYPQVLIPHPARAAHLPYSSKVSGLVYDVRMRFHTEYPNAMEFGAAGADLHPEDPRRIHAIFETLQNANLIHHDGHPDPDPDHILFRIDARDATKAEICLVHEREHYREARRWPAQDEDWLVNRGKELDSIYLHRLTFRCATLAAGGTIEACRAVVAGHVKNSLAIVRPPGHHAEPHEASGFCIFNNVGIAAKVCQRDFPETCRKVLILDWDVHHGNGIQKAFENDPNVLYISIHVYQNGLFYPFGEYGDHLHCGEGTGLGYNVNIPWADKGMRDGDYLYAFQQIVMPIAQEFDPDLVIVAAGFDAAEGDVLGACHVTPPCYAHMTHMLMSLAQGKIAVVLEGGYNLKSISNSALAVTRTLMGDPPDRLLIPDLAPSNLGKATVDLVKKTQGKYWKCMYPKPFKTAGLGPGHGDRMHDVIREWQAMKMLRDYSMSPLMVHRSRLSRSFDEQVLATPLYDQEHPLLIILHDPPQVEMIEDPHSGSIEWHNTYMTDVTKSYIEWAHENNFQIIDVNLPTHISGLSAEAEFEEVEARPTRLTALKEVCRYLWENYIQLGSSSHIFLMGVGEAYAGIVDLITNQEGCEELIDYVIGFICDSTLYPVKRPADDNIAAWYYKHSTIFVANDHPAWEPERQRKVRKKFGGTRQSSKETLSEMLMTHKAEVADFLLSKTADWRRTQDARAKHVVGTQTGSNGKIASTDVSLDGRGKSEDGLRSPNRLPPMGVFGLSPGKRSRDGASTPRS